MSSLHASVDEYLELRRSLGFKLERPGQLLTGFAVYMERAGSETITTELAIEWARQPQDADPSWWGARLHAVRTFARYLHALDPRHEIPPAGLWPAHSARATPFIYRHADITALMTAAQGLRPALRSATYATYIGLLAVTGMRAGEALALDRADLDWSEGLLKVRSGKFGKSRELVLHATTLEALRAYERLRRRNCPRPQTPAFFVSIAGTRLLYKNVHFVFHGLLRQVGLAASSRRCRPRLHDLRHSFAVNTLVAWYQAGLDVAQRMHLLSTYLGHSDPAATYWYLSATPELLALAVDRLERHFERPA